MKYDEIRKIIERLKSDKKAIVIIVIGLLGMLFVAFSDSGKSNSDNNSSQDLSSNLYTETELAIRIEELISSMNGTGKTKVMITFECYEETVYIYDKDEKFHADGETNISNEHIIIDEGDTEAGLKSKTVAPKIRGVAVVCQGGDNPVIKNMIITSLSALLDISTNRISVAPMGD